MITSLSRLATPAYPASTSATGVALRALLTPNVLAAPAGDSNATAGWAGADEGEAVTTPPLRAAPAARDAVTTNTNLSGLAQLLKDIALVMRAGIAADRPAAIDATSSARTDSGSAPTADHTLTTTPVAPPQTADAPSMTPQHVIWSAQAWPGQRAEFQITRKPRDQRNTAQHHAEPDEWHTRVRVDLPCLGKLEAAVGLSAAGLRVAVRAQSASTLNLLESGRDELHDVLADAGLNPVGLHISPLTPG